MFELPILAYLMRRDLLLSLFCSSSRIRGVLERETKHEGEEEGEGEGEEGREGVGSDVEHVVRSEESSTSARV